MDSVISFVNQLALPMLPYVPFEWQWLAWIGLAVFSLFLLSLFIWSLIRVFRRPKRYDKEKTGSKVGPETRIEQPPVSSEPSKEVFAASDGALQAGLAKTRKGFITKVAQLFRSKQVDAHLLDQLEEILFSADVGTKTAQFLFDRVKERLSKDELLEGDKVLETLKEESKKLLLVDAPLLDFSSHHPFVLLIIGVNGAGKTTTIGKLAAQFKQQGKQVMLAAGDTFRAAAVQQLRIWGDRVHAPVVSGKEGSDPSAVIFEGIKQAQAGGVDVLIADTAGRLHVKAELMEELRKVRRVIQKADASAPHETWLVLDATMGQNALVQAATFKEIMNITGIVLTKLDGTAKGGVILGICNELKLPVRFIGVGEGVEDLRTFDPETFIQALFDQKYE